jgi:hypothetical protein
MKRQAFSFVSLLSLLLVAGSAIAQTVHVREYSFQLRGWEQDISSRNV